MSTPTSTHLSTTPTGSASSASRKIPLICSGHSRPVPDLSYSSQHDGFYLISACLGKLYIIEMQNVTCKISDGKPMLRNGENGDWIGTFMGHKGAVWSAQLNGDSTLAITGSADYTAYVLDLILLFVIYTEREYT
jgi:serine-threonine kinase receptor-associated protein